MKIINLTPHALVLQSPTGERTTLAPSGTVARVASTPGTPRIVDGCPVPIADAQVWGSVEGVPAPEDGTLFIVSALVLGHCQERQDVVGPGTGPADGAIRFGDGPQKGQVEAVTRLVRG